MCVCWCNVCLCNVYVYVGLMSVCVSVMFVLVVGLLVSWKGSFGGRVS